MSNALFITMSGTGRVNPTIFLVEELIARGEKVTYISSEEFREKIEKTGAKFKGIKNLSNSKDSKVPMVPINIFQEILELVFNAKEKFDYIIYDSNFIIGNEVGRVLKIPTICSITTFAANESIDVFDIFRYIRPNIEKLSTNSVYMDFVKNLQEKYDIKFPSMLMAAAGTGMLKVVYTSKYFQICGENFDESYKFIGPSIGDRNEDGSLSLEIDDKKKVIYISLGTIFNKSIEFYENCFKAFDNMDDVQIIMSIGKNIDVNTFKSIPSNFIVRNYVSQLEILKQADVFITHAGMNSTNEGLYYDVPLVLIPQSGDQPFVAKRVAQLGAGIIIEKDKVTPEILKESVVKILSDNNFRINSKKIGKSLKEAGGFKKGVDEILNLCDMNK
ncbi:macrolide family glycosyltransferase [Clostridium sp. JS66]|uniref:macrolide family glycosyltransferase n=1 Tax=Clostridium sp. JS66 TaxID=3064705 RepID=UPI00298E4392|nr:macrolide family glycosyltransferase [Clostridium sp. JS66]WPC42713.1 glycosyltransferase [Clostridium sp. JS66]